VGFMTNEVTLEQVLSQYVLPFPLPFLISPDALFLSPCLAGTVDHLRPKYQGAESHATLRIEENTDSVVK
jgi:hypothetical protein